MDFPQPAAEHAWFKQLEGDWTYEHDAHEAPDGTPIEKSSGTERFRLVGPFWAVGEGQGSMGGEPATTLMTLGFDSDRGRFVGTWVGSMMPFLWVYDGELDASGKVLTLSADGPSMQGDGKMCKYRDIIELVSDDHRILRGTMLGDDGEWHQFMETHYYRQPAS